MPSRLDWILHDYPTRLARCDGVLLVDFVGHVPGQHGSPHEHVMKALDEIVAEFPRVGMLGRIRDSRPPDDADRRELTDRLRDLGDRVVTVDLAIEGAGFRGVAFRSFTSALRLMGIAKIPVNVHTELTAARTSFANTELATPDLLSAVEKFFTDPAAENAGT